MQMGLVLVQRTTMTVAPRQELQARLGDPFYELVDYWTHAPRHTVKFNDRGTERTFQYAFAPQSWIHSVMPDEKFGFYMGDMMILNSDLLATHPNWIPYVVLKLYGERFVDDGLDPSGRTKHYEAQFRVIRGAQGLMETPDFVEFIQALLQHDRSGYFEWDEAAARFVDGHTDVEQAKSAYLERHHDSKWVARGRREEALTGLGFGRLAAGFRNHAEAIATLIRSERDGGLLYGAAVLVRAVLQLQRDESLMITAPLSAAAYLLTKEANGLRDLVVFAPNAESRTDVISRAADGKARTTLVALGKRLGHEILGVERAVHRLVERNQAELSTMADQMNLMNTAIETEMAHAGRALQQQEPAKALAIIEGLERRGIPAGLDALQREMARAQDNVSAFEQLKAALRGTV